MECGYIDPYIFLTPALVEVSGQLHALAALPPGKKHVLTTG
jgi:hypothetical protein